MQRERGPGRHRRPPARLPARNSRLRAGARAHWLRLAVAAVRTGRPACQSPAGGGGGAPCRGRFLFARACARNNERDPPGARGLLRPGPARPPHRGEAAPPRRRPAGGTRPAGPGPPPAPQGSAQRHSCAASLSPRVPPPRRAPVPGGATGWDRALLKSPRQGCQAGGSRGSEGTAELRPAGSRRRALSPPALRCRRGGPMGAGPPGQALPGRAPRRRRSPRDRPPPPAGRGVRVSGGLWPGTASARELQLHGRPCGPLLSFLAAVVSSQKAPLPRL